MGGFIFKWGSISFDGGVFEKKLLDGGVGRGGGGSSHYGKPWPVVLMQNWWKGLSPPTAEDVVHKWYGCIYTSKRGPNLFTGKVTQRFL